MKRSLYFFAMMSLLIFGCNRNTEKSLTISGHVAGGDGQTPAMANVHLSSFQGSYTDPLISAVVEEDGTFELQPDAPGPYRLWVTATNHQVAEIPLVLEADDSEIEVEVTLAMNPFMAQPEKVTIIGSWNNFKFSAAENMTRRPDGTFVFETEVDADTVAYQLLGIAGNGHSVNGTQADFYEYDGGGDYRSMLVTDGGKVQIEFDPAMLPTPPANNDARISFDEAHSNLKHLFVIERKVEAAQEENKAAQKAYEQANGNAEGYIPNFDNIKLYLTDKIKQGDTWTRQYAAMKLARLYYYDLTFDEATYALIMNAIPVDSPVWTAVVDPIAQSLTLDDRERAETWLTELAQQNPHHSVQAGALTALAFLNLNAGNQSEFESIIAKLKSDYKDIDDDVLYEIERMDPSSPTALGKPVPEFQVTLLGQDKIVSDKDLIGHYTLVDFWATWCVPCIHEMPQIHQAYEKYHDLGFEILSLSLDNTSDVIHDFRQNRWQMPWRHARIEDGWKSDIVANFNVDGIPSPFLIGPDGKIVASHQMLRGDYLEKTLAKFMGTH